MTTNIGNNLEVFASTPQAIANVVHSLARRHCPVKECKPILDAVNGQAKWLVESGNTLDIANLAWAFTRLGFNAAAMFDEIEARRVPRRERGGAAHCERVVGGGDAGPCVPAALSGD